LGKVDYKLPSFLISMLGTLECLTLIVSWLARLNWFNAKMRENNWDLRWLWLGDIESRTDSNPWA
jgi:hypothetical protein